MKLRGWLAVGCGLAFFFAVGWWSFQRGSNRAPQAAAMVAGSANPERSPAPRLTPEERRRILLSYPEAHLADDLNLPGNTLQQDLGIVASLFAAWRSNFPGRGHPVGDNREITAKLMGGNPNGLVFLREKNRALNSAGELCDRWGTPFFFHAESGVRMEIRSAGPDRRFWTADDAVMVP